VIVCVLFVLSQVGTIYFIHWERFNGPMDEVAGYLEGNMGEDDVFVHFDEHTLHTFAVYVPDHLHVMYLPPGSKVYASPEVHGARVKIVSDLSELSLENKRVWLAMRIDGGNVQNYDRVARELGVEPVPTSPERLYEAMHAEGAEFFGLPNSWYAVVLQPVDPRP
jgi:hypothetical protein